MLRSWCFTLPLLNRGEDSDQRYQIYIFSFKHSAFIVTFDDREYLGENNNMEILPSQLAAYKNTI